MTPFFSRTIRSKDTTWSSRFIVFGTCGLLLAGNLPGADYSLIDLGPFARPAGKTDADPESAPVGINDSATVVAVNDVGGKYGGLIRITDWMQLGTLGGGESFAAGINSHGVVVGYSHNTAIQLRGFVWSSAFNDGVPSNPRMRAIGTFGGQTSEATAVNDLGQVTGTAETATSEFRAFHYDNGTLTDIGQRMPTSLPNSFGLDINDAGHIVGAAYDSKYSGPRAFFYDGNNAVLLGDLGGNDSFALAINLQDLVVGYSSVVRNGSEHAFFYLNGNMVDMGTLGGGYSYALDVNDAGAIVGGSFIDTANFHYRAFLYQDGTMMNLNEMLDASAAGWVLIEAKAINDLGQIVGVGLLNNEQRGFLLEPVQEASRISGIRIAGDDVEVTFTTTQAVRYRVEGRNNLSEASPWVGLSEVFEGNGGEVLWSHPDGAAAPETFYRIKRVP